MNNGKRFKDTKTLVRDIFEAHPEWNAKQIYDRYLILIGDPSKKAVTLNAVQKHVEDLKRTYENIKNTGIEDIWSLASDSIPVDSLPIVIESQRHLNKGWWVREDPTLLTVRQAKWITKLYPLMKRVAIRKNDTVDIYDKSATLEDVMPWLYLIASVYSKHERIAELMDIPFDCSVFDTLFFSTDHFFSASVEIKLKKIDNFLDDELISKTFKDVIEKAGEENARSTN